LAQYSIGNWIKYLFKEDDNKAICK